MVGIVRRRLKKFGLKDQRPRDTEYSAIYLHSPGGRTMSMEKGHRNICRVSVLPLWRGVLNKNLYFEIMPQGVSKLGLRNNVFILHPCIMNKIVAFSERLHKQDKTSHFI